MKYKITAVLFLLTLSVASLANWHYAFSQREMLCEDLKDNTGLADGITDIQDFLEDNVYDKYAFIEAYGAVQKALLKHENNSFDKVVDKEGYLHSGNFYNGFGDDQKKMAINIRRLADYVSGHGSHFVFAMAPMKIALEENKYKGIPYNDFTMLADDLLRHLRYYSVPYLDLRDVLDKSSLTYSETYYRTDHHWKTAAAFEGYTAIVDWLETNGGLKLYRSSATTELSEYRAVNYEGLMFGALGRAVGEAYAGPAEDMEVYFPLKDGPYRVKYGNIDKYEVREGVFSNVVLNADVESMVHNVYEDSGYDLMFLHGLSDYISVINEENLQGSKILMLRDSYSSPLGAYLAQNCGQLDMIYMLGKEKDKVLDLIRENDYDYIIMCIYPENLSLENLQLFEDVEYE